MKWLRKLFCLHPSLVWIRNIHGDEIIERGYMRSLWRCKRCDSVVALSERNGGTDA